MSAEYNAKVANTDIATRAIHAGQAPAPQAEAPAAPAAPAAAPVAVLEAGPAQKAFAVLTRGRTVIMIAHRLSTVVGADKLIVLEEGRVADIFAHLASRAAKRLLLVEDEEEESYAG